MKFSRVLKSDHGTDEITLDMLGVDDRSYAFTLTPEAVPQVLDALIQAATRLAQTRPDVQPGILHTMIGCQPIAGEHQQTGIVLITREGLEIGLLLDAGGRAGLRACIDQLEAGTPHDGPVH